MVRVALSALALVASVCVLLPSGRTARARGVAARPALPVSAREFASAAKQARRPILRRTAKSAPPRTVHVPLPRHRPAHPEPKEETVANAVPVPPKDAPPPEPP